MNPDNLTELLQKGFRVTLGATGALVESLQDSQKRDENLSKMQSDFGKLTEEWADKGAVTELEARNFVDALWTQQANSETTAAGDATVTTSAESVTEPDVQADVEALTAQLAALRAELENLKSSDSNG
ncbi:hypothetical protein [Microcoleus sp. FACHB-68]|uniref:hypothetical protein n=1 Tax=Microcoleus sp. FACHB-68 TaxID=2692826 RepID=UPI00168217EF|nr:hypothetical protein [Microcoleus sp. FACHB-68]MBD1939823.1 hypothetical protein [Microcoleus sp. FACHB-68]